MCNYYCPAGNNNGYIYNSFNNNDTQSVSKNVCYRSNGGSWNATAKCVSGTVSISGASLTCFDGYKHVDGNWYEQNYGCNDVCVYATCAAGNKDGYSYGQMNHKDTSSVNRTIANGTCAATATCSDGEVTFGTEVCTCSPGYIYDANSKTCVGCISDSDCSTGYYCHISSSSFYYSCNSGASANTCQRKCWSVVETVDTFTFWEGDILASSGCSVKQSVDNPNCGAWTGCPTGCNNQRDFLGYTGSGESCCAKHGLFGCSNWDSREIYRCSDNDYVRRYYGDSCRLTLGSTSVSGTMSASGVCQSVSYCGNGVCNTYAENCSSCPDDCGTCAGNGHIFPKDDLLPY
jgi:hypothetical protein